jgi:DNA-binding response OmpR family regulator
LTSDALLAVHLALKIRPDLIIPGLGLPGGDSYGTMTRPRSHFPLAHVPMIILSAANASVHLDRVLEAAADAFVQKPIDSHQLLAAIKSSLGGTQGRVPVPPAPSKPVQSSR